jgi:hypothetical protein
LDIGGNRNDVSVGRAFKTNDRIVGFDGTILNTCG